MKNSTTPLRTTQHRMVYWDDSFSTETYFTNEIVENPFKKEK